MHGLGREMGAGLSPADKMMTDVRDVGLPPSCGAPRDAVSQGRSGGPQSECQLAAPVAEHGQLGHVRVGGPGVSLGQAQTSLARDQSLSPFLQRVEHGWWPEA